jgi:hypothetical protein
METLVLNPSATAQWHALINEAEQLCAAHLDEDLQSYLVFLLMRHSNTTEMAHSVMALEYLDSLDTHGQLRETQLRDVGDKCLLFSGLFPEHAQKRRVRVSYYVNLGVSAYATVSASLAGVRARLFAELSHHFVGLMDILQATREVNSAQALLSPLQALELWQDTGSRHALQTLSLYTKGTPVAASPHETDRQAALVWSRFAAGDRSCCH